MASSESDATSWFKAKTKRSKRFRCRHCKCKHRTNFTGEEHWSKLLLANEVNANVVYCRAHRPSTSGHSGHSGHSSRSDLRSLTSGHSSRSDLRSVTSGHNSRSDLRADSVMSARSSGVGTMSSSDNIFVNLYDRISQWFAERRRVLLKSDSSKGSRRGSVSSNGSLRHRLSMRLMTGGGRSEEGDWSHYNTISSLSSDDSDLSSVFRHASGSTCSSITLASASSIATCPGFDPRPLSPPLASTQRHLVPVEDKFGHLFADLHHRHAPDTPAHSTPARRLRRRLVSENTATHTGDACDSDVTPRPPSTWPLRRRKTADQKGKDDEQAEDDQSSSRESVSDQQGSTDDEGISNKWEFEIPYEDVQLGRVLKQSRTYNILRGEWHGDVIIQLYNNPAAAEIARFRNDVSRLRKVRHDNIALFMGACVVAPHLAIILSVGQCQSLYDLIHVRREKTSSSHRMNIARQVAQAVGYLHARHMDATTLASRNIFLDSRVKLSLIDHAVSDAGPIRPGFACLPRGQLTYMAPERLRTATVVQTELTFPSPHTPACDAFAFGTVIYELLSGSFPYKGESSECVLWRVASGHSVTPDLARLKCTTQLQTLITLCWSHSPRQRPTFARIIQELQRGVGLRRQCSMSHPEHLELTDT